MSEENRDTQLEDTLDLTGIETEDIATPVDTEFETPETTEETPVSPEVDMVEPEADASMGSVETDTDLESDISEPSEIETPQQEQTPSNSFRVMRFEDFISSSR